MSDYNLNHLLSAFWKINPKSIDIDQIQLDAWVNQYTKISNPDFLIIFDISNQEDPILFQKNYKLKFPQGKEVNILSIIDAIDKDSVSKIFKADERVILFAKESHKKSRRLSYRLRFNANFLPNQPRSIVRDMSILSRDSDNKPNLILIAFFDVTELHGKQSNLQIDLKNYDENSPDKAFNQLKKDLKQIVSPSVKITKREKEILELISNGKTSCEIAEKLIHIGKI